MIVFEDKKLVIVTPPHTASGNVHRACCGSLGGRWVMGLTPDGSGIDHHFAKLGNDWLDYRVAVVVRHPVERLVGLYEHHQYAASKNGWQPVVWWQFVAMVLQNHPDLSWFYTSTICDLIGDLKVDAVIRHEHLAEDLRAFVGVDVAIPAREFERDWGPYLAAPVTCLFVEHWGEADMLRFGFSTRFDQVGKARSPVVPEPSTQDGEAPTWEGEAPAEPSVIRRSPTCDGLSVTELKPPCDSPATAARLGRSQSELELAQLNDRPIARIKRSQEIIDQQTQRTGKSARPTQDSYR